MNTSELRINNLIEFNNHIEVVAYIDHNSITCYRDNQGRCVPQMAIEPIPLTEEWLLRIGFNKQYEPMYVNKYKYWLNVSEDYGEDEEINRDGTWFDGIGKHQWLKDGESLSVNTLCRGNYVCNSVDTVHQLQNLYYTLTGKELNIKDK